MPFVESASVLATLWQAGVNYIQGYYLQGPSQSMDYDFWPATDRSKPTKNPPEQVNADR